ncbi:MAG TPA: RidA family protein [Dongiaceae bacterium]|jgi:enamine deaminase RidA (YjgF/YER057c/UK114 family)
MARRPAKPAKARKPAPRRPRPPLRAKAGTPAVPRRIKFLNPETVVKPFSRYSQAADAPGNFRWLHISGQVGATPDGKILEGFTAQAEQAWKNVLAILKAAGMGVQDLVKVGIFLTRTGDIGDSRRLRDEALQGAAPASTMLIVSALAHPDLLVEIEAVAARAA